MIEPTIGRIVWIHDLSCEQPLAAIVAYVHSDTLINVCAFEPDGRPRPMQNVHLVQDSAESNINVIKPYALWMPYQKGQAAKTEEVMMKASQFDLALDDRIRVLEREMHVLMGRSPAAGSNEPQPITDR